MSVDDFDWNETNNVLKEFRSLLSCSFCSDLAGTPYNLGRCSHIFCLLCVEQHKGGNCPVCGVHAPAREMHRHRMLGDITGSILAIEKLLQKPRPEELDAKETDVLDVLDTQDMEGAAQYTEKSAFHIQKPQEIAHIQDIETYERGSYGFKKTSVQESKGVMHLVNDECELAIVIKGDESAKSKMNEETDVGKCVTFWNECSRNTNQRIIKDTTNRNRLFNLRFVSSNGKLTSLSEYVVRMKDKQDSIFYMAGSSMEELAKLPIAERLVKKGYEVLMLTNGIDEYAISELPEFKGKKFQNVAKEGFSLNIDTDATKKKEATKEKFYHLLKWLEEDALKDHILLAEVSERLTNYPCALSTSKFEWTENIPKSIGAETHSTTHEMQKDYYANQKIPLEINHKHPLIKELLKRVESDPADKKARDMALMIFNTATLRSGYMPKDIVNFADHIEIMMRQNLGIDTDNKVEEKFQEEQEEDNEEEEIAEVDLLY